MHKRKREKMKAVSICWRLWLVQSKVRLCVCGGWCLFHDREHARVSRELFENSPGGVRVGEARKHFNRPEAEFPALPVARGAGLGGGFAGHTDVVCHIALPPSKQLVPIPDLGRCHSLGILWPRRNEKNAQAPQI